MSTRVAATEESTVRSTTSASRKRWPLLRHRLVDDVAGATVMAAGFFVFVTVVTIVVANVTEVRISGWEAGTQIVRWFVGAMGGYAAGLYLPLYVTHGWTRRDAARQTAASSALLAQVIAVLVTVGFVLERLVYRVAGWPQTIGDNHLFSSADQYGWILVEHALVFLVWIAAGALVGAGFHRGTLTGMASIPLAVASLVLTEAVVGTGYVGPFPGSALTDADLGPVDAGLALIVPVVLAAVVVLTAVTWAIVRDVAIRERGT